jgi:hypothetical protein
MFKKKQALESIPLKLKLPEDGTYPPRILSPGISLWLRGDNVTAEGITYIKNADNQWMITPDDKHETLVNGTAIVEETVLSDGDYIRKGVWKGIFQADPVADFRQDITELKMEQVYEISPSKTLLKWLQVDFDRVSFDGGETTVQWDEIHSIKYYNTDYRWSTIIYILKDGKSTKLPSKLKRISVNDLDKLVMWTQYYTPFHISTNSNSSVEMWIDAYTFIAHQKLLIPAENKLLSLPDNAEHILDRTTPFDRRLRNIVLGFSFAVVLYLVFTGIYDFVVAENRPAFLARGIALFLTVLIGSFIYGCVYYLFVVVFIRITSKFSVPGKEGKSD